MLLAQQGFFEASKDTLFSKIVIGIALPIISGLYLIKKWPAFRAIADSAPQHWFIGIQFYRLLGIVFLILHAQGLLPAEFALPAGYGDIIVGMLALPVASWYFAQKPFARELTIVWNGIGIADLGIPITTGFFTSPSTVQLLAYTTLNELITEYPLVMVPVFAVPLAMLLHIFSLRTLWYHKSSI